MSVKDDGMVLKLEVSEAGDPEADGEMRYNWALCAVMEDAVRIVAMSPYATTDRALAQEAGIEAMKLCAVMADHIRAQEEQVELESRH